MMDFYAVLDQVVDLLRSRGRVTYGALKLQFGLTDEQLVVLKEELIDAQRLASDEQGRILAWTGDAAVTSSPPPPFSPLASQPPMLTGQPIQRAPASVPQILEAERRQRLRLLHDARIDADYTPVAIDETTVQEALAIAREILEVVRRYAQR
jgi:hypothetical protein